MSSAASGAPGGRAGARVRPIGDGVGMDEDGSAEGGRTRLARGTKPNPPVTDPERGDGVNANAAVPAVGEPRSGDDARVRSALAMAPARSSLPASPDTTRRAVRPSAGGSVPAGVDARGSGPVPAGGAPGGADRAPAQSIREAVEQLIEAKEADEAIAEWMQGGG
jgi:hypothetical protein